jgi:hypothetical protein
MLLRLSLEIHKAQCLLEKFVTRDIDRVGFFTEAKKLDVCPDDILELVFHHAERRNRGYLSHATVTRL